MEIPKIEQLTDSEWDWIEDQLNNVRAFLERNSPKDRKVGITLASLDRAWHNWIQTDPSEGDEINQAVNCVGIAYGQMLVDKVRLDWVIATDDYRTDIAVYCKDSGESLVYPANFVAKRWDTRKTMFLEMTFPAMCEDIKSLMQKDEAAVPSKPWWKFW